jgi:hypothetical protein
MHLDTSKLHQGSLRRGRLRLWISRRFALSMTERISGQEASVFRFATTLFLILLDPPGLRGGESDIYMSDQGVRHISP